jgi:TfoX/Sxy family transcriptional regulator of competence genes
MAYSIELEKRIDHALTVFPETVRKEFGAKKMFGGIAYLYRGKMTVGIIKNDLMVRVVSDKMQDVLSRDEVRPMDFTKRPMKEFIYVSPEGFESEEQLMFWIELGLEHAQRKLKQA